MPLPGGPADKMGNRYELLWTVRCMADVLGGEAETIRLEPPGEAGRGIEFMLAKAGNQEFHQVKRQQAGKGRWSIADLTSVLACFRGHLQREPGALCVFASTEAAPGLDELAERARQSASATEFEREFLTAESHQRDFSELRRRWGGSDVPTAWNLLRRIEMRTVDDRSLEAWVDSQLARLVTGDARTVADVLSSHALDSIHQILDGVDLWRHLETRGYRPTDWVRDRNVVAAVRHQTDHYLHNEVSPITRICRAEAGQVVDAFTDARPAPRVIFVTGEAGAGKSGVSAQVVERMRALGWPVLAFRLDRISLVARPEELAPVLGLPGSPAAVLAALAQAGNGLLVVDQLDAVSMVSGRHPEFFHCFQRLLDQTLAHPHLRVLVMCRSFDLEHDHNLRQLRWRQQTAPVVTVGRLSREAVQATMGELGLNAAALSERQVELLSLPLHLVLLAETVRSDGCATLDFATGLDLYDRFWTAKQQSLGSRRGHPVRWAEVIARLCDTMSRQQALSVHRDLLLDLEADAEALVSEHVLQRDGNRLSFFHEGFFDYAFARLFAHRDGSLPDLVQDGEQHLFRRAQVRQVLLYRRASGDEAGFIKDLRWLLADSRVRFHLRQTGLLVLAALQDPKDEECRFALQLMTQSSEPIRKWARRVLFGSAGWLRVLDELGILAGWLAEEGPNRDLALGILRRWAEAEPERVAALLQPRVNNGDEWHRRIWGVIGWEKAVLRNDGGWAVIRSLIAVTEPDAHVYRAWVEVAPERCCEALAIRLRRIADTTPEVLADGVGRDSRVPYKAAAEAAPAAFLHQICRIVLDLLGRVPPRWGRSGLPRRDGFFWEGVYDYGESAELFEAIAIALGRVAREEPTTFRRQLALLAGTEWRTVHMICAKALAQSGAEVAHDAASYLIDLLGRYEIGDDWSLLWLVRDAVAAMAPEWGQSEFEAVEERVLAVDPAWERRRDAYEHKLRGRAQRLLLEALPEQRLSERGKRRLEEWRRKPTAPAGPRPRGPRGGWVQSPIPESAARYMSDRHWLRAIQRYADDRDRAVLDDKILGGARQLASALQGRAKEEPERFARLCMQFPGDTNSHYCEAVLIGVAEAAVELDLSLLTALLQRCHELPGRPYGRWIARLVSKNAQRDLPPEAIELLSWYGLNDSDPDRDLWREEDSTGRRWYDGDPFFHGINTVRGAVAEAVAALIFARPERIDALMNTVEHLICDPIAAVRACAAELCTAVLLRDASLAIRLFQKLIDSDEALLGTYHVERFLGVALREHFANLQPAVERMLASGRLAVAQAGARRACLAAFDVPEAAVLAERALAGREPLRLGAAQIYAANLVSGADHATCDAALRRLFDDPETVVRAAAINFLDHLSPEDLPSVEPLLRVLIHSAAFAEADDQLLRLLEQTPGHVPALLLDAVGRFLTMRSQEASDISTRTAATASEVGQLLVRAYSQSDDDEFRHQSLTLIDALIGHEAYGIERALELLSR